MVEFAIVAPLLLALVFGIIDFGWAFNHRLDVRHTARESSRLIAVNYQPDPGDTGAAQRADIITEVCDRVDDPEGTTVSLQAVGGGSAPAGSVGEKAEITVTKPISTLTGFFDWALAGTHESVVDVRIEVDATWQNSPGDSAVYSGSCS